MFSFCVVRVCVTFSFAYSYLCCYLCHMGFRLWYVGFGLRNTVSCLCRIPFVLFCFYFFVCVTWTIDCAPWASACRTPFPVHVTFPLLSSSSFLVWAFPVFALSAFVTAPTALSLDDAAFAVLCAALFVARIALSFVFSQFCFLSFCLCFCVSYFLLFVPFCFYFFFLPVPCMGTHSL